MSRISLPLVMLSFALACAMLASCEPDPAELENASIPDPSVASHVSTVGDTAVVEIGDSVRFDPAGVVVSFLRLVGDSRCPTGVTCVWEGNAEVSVRVAHTGGDVELSLHTTLEPRRVIVGPWLLELLAVLPYPSSDFPADPAPLRMVVRLSRTKDGP